MKKRIVSLNPAILAGIQARMGKMAELQEEMTMRQHELEWFIAKETGVNLIQEHWTLDLDNLRLTKD